MTTIQGIRYLADTYMELWAVIHQEHPVYEGGPKRALWGTRLAWTRAYLEMDLARYRAERFKSHIGGTR